jgi:tRNA pseudouridine13 synthase
MKDRHAVTSQWFSVQLPGKKAPDWQAHLSSSIKILQQTRHNRKLRRGALQGNRFSLLIRELQGDLDIATRLCEKIKANGVPNYYGEQRFGHNLYNIASAKNWFASGVNIKSRHKRSLFLSAARSWIFNHILSQRVELGSWNQAQTGDVFMLNGTKSCFADDGDPRLAARTKAQDLHPTGALWGKGTLLTGADIALLEQQVADQFNDLAIGLIQQGLKQQRRALRLAITEFDYDFNDNFMRLSFTLPAGSFATVVLRELGVFSTVK